MLVRLSSSQSSQNIAGFNKHLTRKSEQILKRYSEEREERKRKKAVVLNDVDSVESDYSLSVLEDGYRAHQFFTKENTTRMNIGWQKLRKDRVF